MEIIDEKFCASGDPYGDGSVDYYYAGVSYTLRDGDVEWNARSYNDGEEKASILSVTRYRKTSRGRRGTPERFAEIPYGDPHFALAIQALLTKGHHRIEVLTDDGYVPVDLDLVA